MPKIDFIPNSELTSAIIDPPVPASKIVPEWFKRMTTAINKNNAHRNPDNTSNKTVKACVPFIDALTTGYMITLPCDVVFVDPAKYGVRVLWDVSWQVLEVHSPGQAAGMPVIDGYGDEILKWTAMWSIKPPNGYSLLFTHPLNQFDLPFFTLSGVVDSDAYDAPVSLPFLVKNNFMGKIPKGTPIAQVIPIKRESWTSSIKKFNIKKSFSIESLRTVMDSSYRLRWWNKKNYN